MLLESAALGVVGSLAGIALGTLLAALALALLGGDLGGGYFTGVQTGAAVERAGRPGLWPAGVAAALIGGWWPARQAQRLALAQTLRPGQPGSAWRAPWAGIVLIAASALLACVPPILA